MESDLSEAQKIDELKGLWNNSTKRGVDTFHPEVKVFYKEMQDKYPYETLLNAKLWHIIAGGTLEDSFVNFDLPGGEIEDFIRHKAPLIEVK